jgi:hypothetical protein
MASKEKKIFSNLLNDFLKFYKIEFIQKRISKTFINIEDYPPSKLGAFVWIVGSKNCVKNISECSSDEINGKDIICFENEKVLSKGKYGMSTMGKVYFTIETLRHEFKKRNIFPNSIRGLILCEKRTEDLDRVISNLNLDLEVIADKEEEKRVEKRKNKAKMFTEKYKNKSTEEDNMIDNFLLKNYGLNFYDNKEYVLPEFKIANRKIDGLINLDPSHKFIHPDKSKIVDVSNRDLLLIQAKSNKELKKHGLMGVMGQTFFAIHLINMYYQNIKSVRGIALVGEIPKDQIGIYETFKEYGDKGELNIKIVK